MRGAACNLVFVQLQLLERGNGCISFIHKFLSNAITLHLIQGPRANIFVIALYSDQGILMITGLNNQISVGFSKSQWFFQQWVYSYSNYICRNILFIYRALFKGLKYALKGIMLMQITIITYRQEKGFQNRTFYLLLAEKLFWYSVHHNMQNLGNIGKTR